MSEFHFQTLAELSELLRLRKLSPLELTDALLQRIEATDPQVRAFITVTADQARAKAAGAEIAAGRYRGPLHGIAFALKDIFSSDFLGRVLPAVVFTSCVRRVKSTIPSPCARAGRAA